MFVPSLYHFALSQDTRPLAPHRHVAPRHPGLTCCGPIALHCTAMCEGEKSKSLPLPPPDCVPPPLGAWATRESEKSKHRCVTKCDVRQANTPKLPLGAWGRRGEERGMFTPVGSGGRPGLSSASSLIASSPSIIPLAPPCVRQGMGVVLGGGGLTPLNRAPDLVSPLPGMCQGGGYMGSCQGSVSDRSYHLV